MYNIILNNIYIALSWPPFHARESRENYTIIIEIDDLKITTASPKIKTTFRCPGTLRH